ncbi:MAG: hypothetical protein QW802_02950 [Candidatus Altiarchaeota archaeon]
MSKKNSNNLEFKRQMFHLILGLSITFAVYFLRPIIGQIITAIPLIIALILMLLIPKFFPEIKIINHILYHFERDENIINFPFKGAFWYGLGILFPILFINSINVACAIIIVISTGDAFSTLIGKFYGKHNIGEKTIEGFLAFIFSSFFGAIIFVDFSRAITFAIIGGLVELLPKIDDNFLVPFSLTIISIIFLF